ncbi:MAG: aminotransferase class III-fold pyridoxal phosphate-dependent enzyme [Deltaproteobacteria bacterium]|nr:aminotransferase class III-fold pyridoxal phosphate-dependent enzyme [Deltaproteobacteria bacterium]
MLDQTPTFDVPAAEDLARRLYGLESTSPPTVLASERDQNFLIRASRGQFVLKISNAAEPRANLVAQNEMISWLTRADWSPAGTSVRVIPSLRDEHVETVEQGPQRHFVRLVTFVCGRPMASLSHYSDPLLRHLGVTVGAMTNALAGFDHPAFHYEFHWDLAQCVSVVQSRLELIDDPVKRGHIALLVRRFQEHTVPLLGELPRSVIHNDANDGNLIVETVDGAVVPNRIAGVIDFGDAVWGWRVGELAIAIAYAILDHTDPIAAMGQVLDGYQTTRSLTEVEASALFGLVCMRLCTSAAMSAEQQRQRPDDPYLSVSQAPIANTLPSLAELPFPFAEALIKQRCGLGAPARAQRVCEWLARRPEPFVFPIGDGRPTDDAMLVMDLGVESPHSIGPDSITEPMLSRVIGEQMAAASAEVAIGRYLEPRLLYASALFESGAHEQEDRTVHLGMDLFAAAGTSVKALLDGEIFLINDNDTPSDYGPVVIVRHATDAGEPFYSLYGHLARTSLIGLEPGRRLIAGETFATLGQPHENGGWPPHLHLQLIVDLLGLGTDFPGVCRASRVSTWRQLCPDPNLVLRIPAASFPKPSVPKAVTLERRRSRMGSNLSIGYQRPLAAVRGWMQYLFDENGHKFIDAYNNVPHVGHCHPRVVEALHSQARRLNTNTRYLSNVVVEYAEALAATMPEGLDVCYLLNSASEANELAVRLARVATGGRDLIVLEGAYHGHTTSLIDISPYKHDGPGGAGAPSWVHTAPVADTYRGRFRDPETAGAEYAEAVGEILERVQREGRQPSGFIAESCPSVGGQILFPEGYLADVYRRVRAAGGLCIADDVQTGFGRLGKWMYGFEQQEVVPDIVVLGKPIGNGHPLAALVTTRKIAASFDNGMEFFSTFGGNTVSAAVGKAVLDVILEESLPSRAESTGEFMLARLRELGERHPIIGDVRGSGLFIGVELVRDRQTLEPADREASYVSNRMRERRILIGTDGPLHNVIKIRPPMPFSRDDAETLVRALDSTLGELR